MKWIKCSERLPEKGQFVLLTWEPSHEHDPHGCFWSHDKVKFNHKTKKWEGEFKTYISHWMKLPMPPGD